MLKDERVKAFVFIGHTHVDEEGTILGLGLADKHTLTPSDVRSALGGRRLEHVDLRACESDIPEWREAFGNPESFAGMKGLYNPIVGIDWGNPLPTKKKTKKKKKNQPTPAPAQ